MSETTKIEVNGVNPVPDSERYGKPSDLFPVWFSWNISIFGITLGIYVFGLGLSVWQAIAAGVIGYFLSCSFVGILAVGSVRTGLPTLVQSRFAFGYHGNKIPTFFGYVANMGWKVSLLSMATTTLADLVTKLAPSFAKADGYPTYNFANVIDDHSMHITHVVRGCEYLSSAPKYNLLYEAFGWEVPTYVHLPLIMGKNEDGSVSKLSKRHGATSFEDLMADGYLPEAVTNYIALLGWCPKDNQEMFTLEGLTESFSIDGISKSPAVFDYDKLTWFNGEYIRRKSPEEFLQLAKPYFRQAFPDTEAPYPKLVEILQPRVTRLTQIPEMIGFFQKLPGYEKELFINKKSKTNLENSKEVLEDTIALLEALPNWNHDGIHDCLIQYAQEKGLKNGTVMWPVRIAAAGQLVTPGGAIEILEILGREESLRRLRLGLAKL